MWTEYLPFFAEVRFIIEIKNKKNWNDYEEEEEDVELRVNHH